jgi:hypothetical protein
VINHHNTEQIVSACLGGHVRVWDIEQRRCLTSMPCVLLYCVPAHSAVVNSLALSIRK